MQLTDEWNRVLRDQAAGYAALALADIAREFPADVHHLMTGPDDFPARAQAADAGVLRQHGLALLRGDALAACAAAAGRC